jgi:hypothetical protein
MTNEQILSWVVTIVGLAAFLLAGRKVWWSWYINIACQIFWYLYAWVSDTPAFFISATVYSVVFTINAIKWTKDYFSHKARIGQYQTKSSPVDAQRFDGGSDNAAYIMDWLAEYDLQAWWKEPAESYVNTDGRYLKAMPETIRILDREGTLDLCPGEYVVIGSNNRVYIFEGDAFESVYERIT